MGVEGAAEVRLKVADATPKVDDTRSKHVMAVYGTRPEAVKVAPLVLAMRADPRLRVTVAVTGQHREMLDQVNQVFGITPEVDLNIHAAGQTLTDITCRSLTGMTTCLAEHRPDAVLVQGDTSTTFAAALAAFYAQIPVIHAEAGLRTQDRYNPFPEEINRRLTSQITTLHLAPTGHARTSLLAEGIDPQTITVTGNSVIDALMWTVARPVEYADEQLATALAQPRPMILVTAHRRESWGEPMERIGRAVATLAQRYPDHLVVFPAHRNPLVRQAIFPSIQHLANVIVTEPLPYGQFCHVMDRAQVILTDSGGVQEEGPSLGKPVLVMRENTERPEAVHAGTVRLVGTSELAIVDGVAELIDDPAAYARMARAVNPYGDGRAGERTVAAIGHLFGLGPRADDFSTAEGGAAQSDAEAATSHADATQAQQARTGSATDSTA